MECKASVMDEAEALCYSMVTIIIEGKDCTGRTQIRQSHRIRVYRRQLLIYMLAEHAVHNIALYKIQL